MWLVTLRVIVKLGISLKRAQCRKDKSRENNVESRFDCTGQSGAAVGAWALQLAMKSHLEASVYDPTYWRIAQTGLQSSRLFYMTDNRPQGSPSLSGSLRAAGSSQWPSQLAMGSLWQQISDALLTSCFKFILILFGSHSHGLHTHFFSFSIISLSNAIIFSEVNDLLITFTHFDSTQIWQLCCPSERCGHLQGFGQESHSCALGRCDFQGGKLVFDDKQQPHVISGRTWTWRTHSIFSPQIL